MANNSPYPCPACGFGVFPEPPGSYDICPVCGWEDDDVQLRFPAMRGGANKESLYEWQRGVLRRLPLDVADHEDHRRCPDWRPLAEGECGDTTGMPTSGLTYFEAVGAKEAVYYWRKGAGREGDR